MSAKQTADKAKKEYPWTARQKRRAGGQTRLHRKQNRVATRNL